MASCSALRSLLLVLLYPLAKRVTWWPQAMLGVTFGLGGAGGYAAGDRAARCGLALALYGAAILWILGYDTIYAHQDREDDALVGVGSTARLFGERTAPFLAACYGGDGRCCWRWPAGWPGWAGWFFPALALPAALLARQVATLDIDDPRRLPAAVQGEPRGRAGGGAAFLIGRLDGAPGDGSHARGVS